MRRRTSLTLTLLAGALVLAWAAWRRAPLRHPEPGASTRFTCCQLSDN